MDAEARRRVLLIDDDPVVRMLAAAVLGQAGFEVETADDGETGVERFRSGDHFDVIITDLQMPKLDGHGVIRAIRGAAAGAHVPIVVLTGSDDAGRRDELLAVGATACLTKPIDGRRFAARLRALL